MKQLELTPRLHKIAELIPRGAKVADIGTDHAYLPVWLLLQDRITGALAADINKGPLDRARKTAAEYSCTENISFLLCDGLSAVPSDAADTIVIAGMGGETIVSILQAAKWLCGGKHELILQPMSTQEVLRGWLWRNGFDIMREELVCEGDKLYNILCVKSGGAKPMTPAEEWVGRQQPPSDQPLRGLYLERTLFKLGRAIAGVEQGSGSENAAKLAELKALYCSIDQMKKEWDEWQR